MNFEALTQAAAASEWVHEASELRVAGPIFQCREQRPLFPYLN